MRWFFTSIIWMALTAASTPLAAQNTVRDSLHSLSIKDWQFRKIVGFNTTPLIAQLIPFNRSNPREAGPYLMRFKRYKSNGRISRFSMGVNLNFADDPEFSLNFGFGREKRRSFAQRWVYTRGFDFNILLGNINLPGQPATVVNAILGCGPLWGLEYALAPRITVGTETALVMGVNLNSFGIVAFQIIPPVGLFVHYYL